MQIIATMVGRLAGWLAGPDIIAKRTRNYLRARVRVVCALCAVCVLCSYANVQNHRKAITRPHAHKTPQTGHVASRARCVHCAHPLCTCRITWIMCGSNLNERYMNETDGIRSMYSIQRKQTPYLVMRFYGGKKSGHLLAPRMDIQRYVCFHFDI